MGQIKYCKLHIVTAIKATKKTTSHQYGQVHEIWKSCFGTWRKICRSKSHHCQTIRRWDSRSSIRSCSCSWYRQIPKEGDKTNGKEESCQLQPLDADSIQCRCCSEQIRREQRCSEGRE